MRILSSNSVSCASPSSESVAIEKRAPSSFYPLTVYVHVQRAPTGPEAIEYWFFYYYDAWRLRLLSTGLYQTHEGDWEHVTVFVQQRVGQPPAAALPVGIQYAWHDKSSTLAWAETERCLDPCTLPSGPGPVPVGAEHPLVFVGLGSHASYPFRDAWFPWKIILNRHIGETDSATGGEVSPPPRLVALRADDPAFLPGLPVRAKRPGGASLRWGKRGSRVPKVADIHASGPLSPQQQSDPFWKPFQTAGEAQPLVSLFGGGGICTTSGRAIEAWWGGPFSDANTSIFRLGTFGSSELLTSGAAGRDHYLTSYDTKTAPIISLEKADQRLACALPGEAEDVRLTQLLLSLHDTPDSLAAGDAWAWQVHFPRRDEPEGAPQPTAIAPVTLIYRYRGTWWRAVFKGVPRDAQDAVLQGTPDQPSLGIDWNGDGVINDSDIQLPVSRDPVKRYGY
jgi:hypothetical protein